MQTTETALARRLCWKKRNPHGWNPFLVTLLIIMAEPPAFQIPSLCFHKN